MNVHLAMAIVAELLDNFDAGHEYIFNPREAEAVREVLADLLFIRKRAQELNLLNLVTERKLASISNVPPPLETERNLPEVPEGAEESST